MTDADPAPVPAGGAIDSGGFGLHRDAHGHLVLRTADGRLHEGVVPVRSFPLAAPREAIALVGADGRELAWIERLDALPPAARALVEQEIAEREFMPVIARLVAVSSFATPSVWQLETDRGLASMTLRSEDDIRRLAGGGLLVTSGEGVVYRVLDRRALDRQSRRLLDRFL